MTTPLRAFLLRLVPPRPDFMTTMTDDERAVMGEHVAYWSGQVARGSVLAFGPVADPAGGYGIGIALVQDVAAVERLRDEDPAMLSGRGFSTHILAMPRLITADLTV